MLSDINMFDQGNTMENGNMNDGARDDSPNFGSPLNLNVN